MYQEMVYYNRMHVKTRFSQSILSKIVAITGQNWLYNPYVYIIKFPTTLRTVGNHLRLYSKSSLTLTLTLTLNEWRFNLSFSRVSMLFLNSWRVSSHIR